MQQTNSYTSSFRLFFFKIIVPLFIIVGVGGCLWGVFFEKEVILNSSICGAYKVNRIINETHPEEIPIFGSSRAEGGYIPDMLGPNYFNYGLDGTGSNVMLFFLKEECKKQKTSQLILLNFDLNGFYYALGDISNYIYNANYLPVRNLLDQQYKPLFRIPFIKYYGQYEVYFKYYMNNKMNLTKYTNKGASADKNKMASSRFNQLVMERKRSVGSFSLDTTLENEYLDLINANPQRIFVFVIAPYHPSCFERFKNLPQAQEFLDNLRKIKNVRVFDFSREIYADSLFLNTSHLNYYGAIRFSKELKDSIKTVVF